MSILNQKCQTKSNATGKCQKIFFTIPRVENCNVHHVTQDGEKLASRATFSGVRANLGNSLRDPTSKSKYTLAIGERPGVMDSQSAGVIVSAHSTAYVASFFLRI